MEPLIKKFRKGRFLFPLLFTLLVSGVLYAAPKTSTEPVAIFSVSDEASTSTSAIRVASVEPATTIPVVTTPGGTDILDDPWTGAEKKYISVSDRIDTLDKDENTPPIDRAEAQADFQKAEENLHEAYVNKSTTKQNVLGNNDSIYYELDNGEVFLKDKDGKFTPLNVEPFIKTNEDKSRNVVYTKKSGEYGWAKNDDKDWNRFLDEREAQYKNAWFDKLVKRENSQYPLTDKVCGPETKTIDGKNISIERVKVKEGVNLRLGEPKEYEIKIVTIKDSDGKVLEKRYEIDGAEVNPVLNSDGTYSFEIIKSDAELDIDTSELESCATLTLDRSSPTHGDRSSEFIAGVLDADSSNKCKADLEKFEHGTVESKTQVTPASTDEDTVTDDSQAVIDALTQRAKEAEALAVEFEARLDDIKTKTDQAIIEIQNAFTERLREIEGDDGNDTDGISDEARAEIEALQKDRERLQSELEAIKGALAQLAQIAAGQQGGAGSGSSDGTAMGQKAQEAVSARREQQARINATKERVEGARRNLKDALRKTQSKLATLRSQGVVAGPTVEALQKIEGRIKGNIAAVDRIYSSVNKSKAELNRLNDLYASIGLVGGADNAFAERLRGAYLLEVEKEFEDLDEILFKVDRYSEDVTNETFNKSLENAITILSNRNYGNAGKPKPRPVSRSAGGDVSIPNTPVAPANPATSVSE